MPFCHSCGAEVNPQAVVCVKCGVALNGQVVSGPAGPVSDKEWLVSLLLCLFLGYLGIHRFYTGHTVIGVLQLLTVGGCGIWTLIDFILIITGSMTDAQGRALKK